MIQQTSPRGETIYWIGPAGDAREAGEGTDFHAAAHGAVSVTPLQVDLTDHAALAGVARVDGRDGAMSGAGSRSSRFPVATGPGRASAGSRPDRRCCGRRRRCSRRMPMRRAWPRRPAWGWIRPTCVGAWCSACARPACSNEAVLAALDSVPRHLFVDGALVTQAYEDTSLPIGHGQTISKPSVVARMIELLMGGAAARSRGRSGKVLEIGTGCGYQAALLARLARRCSSNGCARCTTRRASCSRRCV